MLTYWNVIRRFNRDILIYLLFNSSLTLAYPGNLSVLVNLYLLRLGYHTEFIGMMQGAGMLVWGVLALPATILGARLGPKKSIILSMFLLSGSALLVVGAGWLVEPWRAPGLVIAWMMLWGTAALVSVNSLPYLMAITDDENRSYVFSIQQMVTALLILVGSLVSGALPGILAEPLGVGPDHPLPYQLTMLFSPLFYFTAGLVFFKARNISVTGHETGEQKAQKAPLRVFVLFFLIVLLQSGGDGAVRTFFNVYLDADLKMPVAQIGATLGLSQVLPVVGSLAIPLAMARLGTRGAMLAANTASLVFIGLLAAIANGTAAALSFMGFAAMGMVTAITRSILSQEMVSPRWRTTTSAIATTGQALGWGVSAWWGGALITAVGFRGLFILGAVLVLLASVVVVIEGREKNIG